MQVDYILFSKLFRYMFIVIKYILPTDISALDICGNHTF